MFAVAVANPAIAVAVPPCAVAVAFAITVVAWGCIGYFQRIVTTGTICASLPRLVFKGGCHDGGRL